MNKISKNKILSLLEHDFPIVINQHPFLKQINEKELFLYEFTKKWESFLESNYIFYPSVLYTLRHSFNTVYAVGLTLESLFLEIKHVPNKQKKTS